MASFNKLPKFAAKSASRTNAHWQSVIFCYSFRLVGGTPRYYVTICLGDLIGLVSSMLGIFMGNETSALIGLFLTALGFILDSM